jgi:predicted esterase/catechol-2,3-dioxygenase
MGAGITNAVALAIPQAALGYWVQRLLEHGVDFDGPAARFDERVLTLRDPDGLTIELVTRADANAPAPWPAGPVPIEHAIAGLVGAALWASEPEPSEAFLADTLGFLPGARDGTTRRFTLPASGHFVDVRGVPGFWSGHIATGTIHHVAWRATDDAEQEAWRATLSQAGSDVTAVRDRQYFRSIYFSEPGGALFEIATDGPGFTVDEPADELGSRLMLPARLERHRAELRAMLPPLPGEEPTPVDMQDDDLLGFAHRFLPGDPTLPALLLLHGTGGNEDDLVPLGPELLPGARLLSPRGKVLEGSAPRFFRRLPDGTFDIQDLIARTFELAGFIEAASARYGIRPRDLVAVGYSNGANVAGSLMLLRPDLLAGAVLFRPMPPFEPESPAGLDGVEVLLAPGRHDPLVAPAQIDLLAGLFKMAGAQVEVAWAEAGHQLTRDDLISARDWLSERWVSGTNGETGV